jgi:hypothetical protein
LFLTQFIKKCQISYFLKKKYKNSPLDLYHEQKKVLLLTKIFFFSQTFKKNFFCSQDVNSKKIKTLQKNEICTFCVDKLTFQ